MEMATLGRTGLEVSRLGVGLAEIGYQLTTADVKQVGRVLNTALDGGINYFDTAECYGVAEELIGRTVAHRRHEFILATKVGHVGSDGQLSDDWTASTMKMSIDRSLARMKTDYVDVLQLHAFDIATPPPDEVLQVLMDARRAGKTRFVGYSQENEAAEWAVESGLFDTLQTTFSVVDQRARYGLFEKARIGDVGIILKRPLANAMWGRSGLPADYYNLGDGVGEEIVERAKAMADMGPITGAPEDPIAMALGFVLAHPGVHTAIVGTRNPEHMLANIEIVEKQLPIAEQVVEELHQRFDRLGGDWRSLDWRPGG